jgi:hypothetical protein
LIRIKKSNRGLETKYFQNINLANFDMYFVLFLLGVFNIMH